MHKSSKSWQQKIKNKITDQQRYSWKLGQTDNMDGAWSDQKRMKEKLDALKNRSKVRQTDQ